MGRERIYQWNEKEFELTFVVFLAYCFDHWNVLWSVWNVESAPLEFAEFSNPHLTTSMSFQRPCVWNHSFYFKQVVSGSDWRGTLTPSDLLWLLSEFTIDADSLFFDVCAMVVNHYWPEHAPGNFYGNPYKVLRCKGKNEIKMQITRILRDDQNMFIWEKASFWQVCFRFFFLIFFFRNKMTRFNIKTKLYRVPFVSNLYKSKRVVTGFEGKFCAPPCDSYSGLLHFPEHNMFFTVDHCH